MKSIHKRQLFIFGVSLLFLGACSKMNDLHDKYLQKGETIYVGKPDSVKIFGGKERVKIQFWSSDPKAANLIIYWLSRTDSTVFAIPAHLAADSLEVIISGLPEYNYGFELVTTNKEFGNRSVPFQSSGNSYGTIFQSGLLDRLIGSSQLSDSNELQIDWLGAIENAIGTEVEYLNSEGTSTTRFVPINESSTLIEGVTAPVNYRTLFLPEQNAIDTFYTAYKPIL